MSAPAQLVIMARAPRLGAVKRRLARDVGMLAAWRFYHGNTAAIVRRLGCDSRWRSWLAITPDRSAITGRGLWSGSCPLIPQGQGNLGARMGRLLRDLPPGPVVIVGSDIPDLQAEQIARAFRLLGSNEWVFGPAADGGYWLIGARRRRMPRDPFAGVRWSSQYALADTRANLKRARIAYLEEMTDVDTGRDLARSRAWRKMR